MAEISVNLTAFSVRSFYAERQLSSKLNGSFGSILPVRRTEKPPFALA